MRVRLKSRQKGPSKFQSDWSGLHEVISVKGVVTLKELSSGREYVTHHDRLSNPLLSGKESTSREIESNANLEENSQEPEEDLMQVENSEEALMRTRSGRIVKPPRNQNFEYSFILPSATSSYATSRLVTSTLSQTSASMSDFSDASLAGSLQPFSVLDSHANDSRIRREQRTRLEVLGERVYWVLDLEGSDKMAVLLKCNGTLFFLELQRADWICPFDGESITNALQHDPWPRPSLFRALTEEEVRLPRTIEEFPGFENNLHEQPNYGFSGLWQAFVRERAQQTGIVIPPLEISINPISTQPVHNPLALSTSVTSPITSLKAPTCASPWTTALRAPTVVVTTPLATGFTTAGAQRPASEPSFGYLRPL